MITRTVLLADADPDSRAVYSLMLEYHGLRVLSESDPTEAYRIACEQGPDLAVVELFLPFVEAQPLVSLLKRDRRTSHLPVIGLTVLSSGLGIAPGLVACDSHLVKPCSPTRLLGEVQRLLDLPASHHPGYRSAAVGPCPDDRQPRVGSR